LHYLDFFYITLRQPISTLFPYTTLFRSSTWSPSYPQETTLVTHLDAALRTSPSTWTELNSVAFDTDEVPSGQYLHLDVHVPAPSGSWGGAVRPIFVCPSAGHFWTEFGSDESFHAHPFDEFYTLEWQVPGSVQQTLMGSYTDCFMKIALNAWNGSNPVILDHLRFTNTPLPQAPDSSCTQYTQLPVPPFVAGGTLPDGSPLLPYRLCTAEQLQTVVDTPSLWDDHFVLGNNLDLTNVAGQVGTFSGTLEGLGYRLSNFGRGAAPAAGGLIALLTGSVTNPVAHNCRVHATALGPVGALVDDNAGSITNITLSAGVSSGAGFSRDRKSTRLNSSH